MASSSVLCRLALLAQVVTALVGLAHALPKLYAEPGQYGVGSTVVTVPRSGVGFFQGTIYYPTASGLGGRCTDVATCYLQSMATSQEANLASGQFPLVTFGLNTFISGQEVYGSTMRHIASHGFIVVATNSRYIQPAAEAVEMVDMINWLEKQGSQRDSRFYGKLNLAAGVGTLGYSQGGAASLDAAALLGDRCAACISQHAQPSMSARQIKCPVFLHSGDNDSLTGIMRAMIWPAAPTPKIFAVMRNAHHLTPVPPSPWDPWSLAWLKLYQQGDMGAGQYLWGSVPGSLRALSSPVGTMSYVLFDPDAVWSPPYTQFGINPAVASQPFSASAENTVQIEAAEESTAEYYQPGAAATPAAPQSSAFGMWPGLSQFTSGAGASQPSFLSSLFGGGGTGGSSFLQSFMPSSSSMFGSPGGFGLGNIFGNSAGSLADVYNVPVGSSTSQPSQGTTSFEVAVAEEGTVEAAVPASGSNSYWTPVETVTESLRVPTRDTTSASTLDEPYCMSHQDCCSPGQCVIVRGMVKTAKMCSLSGDSLGKLSSDPTCIPQKSIPQAEAWSTQYSDSPPSQKFAIVPTQNMQPQQAAHDPNMQGPRLNLLSCDSEATMSVSSGSPGSEVIVIGSIYEPKHGDQLSLLSNSHCPIIDIGIKLPKQHLSQDFLKSQMVKVDSSGSGRVVFLNQFDEACSDFIYQAVDLQSCTAGPTLDLRQ